MRPLLASIVTLFLSATSVATACVGVVDEQGREFTWLAESPTEAFVGDLRNIRLPEMGDMPEVREQRFDRSDNRRAMSDAMVLEYFSRYLRVATFDVRHWIRGNGPDEIEIWFEANGVCPGPFNDGLPLVEGQFGIVFLKPVDTFPTGWIPNLASVELLDDPSALDVAHQMFAQFETCPAPSGPTRDYTIPTLQLKAPAHGATVGGFGRGCVLQLD